MKQQKQFRSVTSLLMIMTMVIISSFCILISSNQSTQNHSINNASNEITASNTSNDPIFYINQFEVDSLTIPGLGPTNWPNTADLSDGSYSLDRVYAALSIEKKNSNAWKIDGNWQGFNSLVTKGYISDNLSIGVVDNWIHDATTSLNNIASIVNTPGYTWRHNNFGPVTIPVSVPLWMKPITKSKPMIDSSADDEFYNASWENRITLDDQTYVELYTTMFFNDWTQPYTLPLLWNDLNIKNFIELKYDGKLATIRFKKSWNAWIYLYPRIHAPWWDPTSPDEDWHMLGGFTYHDFPSFEFHDSNQVPYEYAGDYIDIGVIDFVWIQDNNNIVIKNHGGDKTIALSDSDFVVYKIDGEKQVGHLWCEILARLELTLSLQTNSGSSPVATPSTDLDYIDSEEFNAFHVTYWWWDPYGASTIDDRGTASFKFIDAANPERVFGTINIPIETCL